MSNDFHRSDKPMCFNEVMAKEAIKDLNTRSIVGPLGLLFIFSHKQEVCPAKEMISRPKMY